MKEDFYNNTGPPPGFVTWENAYRMYVSEHLSAWAKQLDHAFDAMWASSWRETLIDTVAKPLGLDRWPVLPSPTRSNPAAPTRWAARPARSACHIDRYPRAFAWCDDFLYDRPEHSWPIYDRTPPRELADVAVPFLLIKPCARVGLTQAHIDDLLELAAEHSASSDARTG